MTTPVESAAARYDGALDEAAAPQTLLVCVNYDSDEETACYLRSLHSLEQHKLNVVVVDNGEHRGGTSLVSDANVSVLRSPTNLGYFGGARYALSLYLERNPLPDWVIVSNVDLTIQDSNFMERLAQLNLSPDVAVIASSIRSNLTGIDQNPYLRSRPARWRMHSYKWLYRSRVALNTHELTSAVFHRLTAAASRKKQSRDIEFSSQEIYAAHGSFLIFSKNYFERGGDLNYPEFLFGEEIYVAEKVRSLGMKVLYEPSLVVVHEEHRSTKLFKSREVAAYVAASAAYCANTFFPLSQ
jgi:GT2 family glycosyltransferase